MKRSQLLSVFAICLIAVFCSCKKIFHNSEKLPPETQQGKNTFGCKINGSDFYPKLEPFNPTNVIQELENQYSISVKRDRVYVRLLFTATTTGEVQVCARYDNLETGCMIDHCENGIVNISKLDMNNRIISGTFQFVLPANDSCPEIKATEGRFDYKF